MALHLEIIMTLQTWIATFFTAGEGLVLFKYVSVVITLSTGCCAHYFAVSCRIWQTYLQNGKIYHREL